MGGWLGPIDDAVVNAGEAAYGASADVTGGALDWAVDSTGWALTGTYDTLIEDPLMTTGAESADLAGAAGSQTGEWLVGAGDVTGDTVGTTVGSALEGVGLDKLLLAGAGLIVLLYVLSNSSGAEAAGESVGDLA